MKPKQTIFKDEARNKLFEGVKKLTEAVACTMGPGGRNVVLKEVAGFPRTTKDGVTVAKEFTLEDLAEDAGANVCKMAAIKANSNAGDGTTTATVLTNSLLLLGLQAVHEGANPHLLKEGLNRATEDLIAKLEELAVQVDPTDREMIKQVASISGNDEQVGKVVAEAFLHAGKDGFVTWETDTSVPESEIDVREGLTIPTTYESAWFITDQKNKTAEYDDPVVIVYGDRIVSPNDLLDFIERVLIKYDEKPIVLISTGLEGDALKAAIMNRVQGKLNFVAVRAPLDHIDRDQSMMDIAAFCGAEYIPAGVVDNISKANVEIVGKALKISVGPNKMELILDPDNREGLTEYIKTLEGVENAKERIARLEAKVSIVRVGGKSYPEIDELKYRYEDAIQAVNAALKKGVLPGGGAGLIVAASKIHTKDKRSDYVQGYEILKEAIKAPMYQILKNSGVDFADDIAKTIAERNRRNFIWTIDGLTGDIVKAFKKGILDPVAVTESSLEAAVSVAGLYCTTDCVMTEIVQE